MNRPGTRNGGLDFELDLDTNPLLCVFVIVCEIALLHNYSVNKCQHFSADGFSDAPDHDIVQQFHIVK